MIKIKEIWGELRKPKKRVVSCDKRVGILYICTGKYVVFWEQFFRSMENNFLPGVAVDYYVFTDAEHIYCEERTNVHKIYQQRLGWPYDTLKRFDMFLGVEAQLKDCDYLYFFNANCFINKRIQWEDFIPTHQERFVFTIHPGMYGKVNTEYTYERRRESTAYIPEGEGKVYVAGGLNGGETSAFLAMAHELSKRIRKDEESGIIAIYHDESQINRYVYEQSDYKLLDAGFCYPEGWKIPFRKKIIILDKSKYFDDRKIKEESSGNDTRS